MRWTQEAIKSNRIQTSDLRRRCAIAINDRHFHAYLTSPRSARRVVNIACKANTTAKISPFQDSLHANDIRNQTISIWIPPTHWNRQPEISTFPEHISVLHDKRALEICFTATQPVVRSDDSLWVNIVPGLLWNLCKPDAKRIGNLNLISAVCGITSPVVVTPLAPSGHHPLSIRPCARM